MSKSHLNMKSEMSENGKYEHASQLVYQQRAVSSGVPIEQEVRQPK
jgi:hypothetical protein